MEFCRTVLEKERELPYSIIAWNYMPPSGGGLLHPHQQLIITDEPGNLYRKVMRESKNYRQKWGENFWEELCRREEEAGERFIGRIEEGYWLTAFCPQGVLGEIMAVFPGRSTIYDLDEKIIDGLVKGLLCLFKYFDSKNICSFNLALFAAPCRRGRKRFFPSYPGDTAFLHEFAFVYARYEFHAGCLARALLRGEPRGAMPGNSPVFQELN